MRQTDLNDIATFLAVAREKNSPAPGLHMCQRTMCSPISPQGG
jgi:hypothetical protein